MKKCDEERFGEWCFTAHVKHEENRIVGTEGENVILAVFPQSLVVIAGGKSRTYDIGYPAHVHQPLIQTVVDDSKRSELDFTALGFDRRAVRASIFPSMKERLTAAAGSARWRHASALPSPCARRVS